MIVKQFVIILGALYAGNVITDMTHIPIPSNVLGMTILFVLLYTGIVKLKDVKETAEFIIKHLSIFFIVPSVGIIIYLDLFSEEFIQTMVPLFVSIILGFFAAGKITELLMRKEGEKND